ncbi:hypothetical protein [Ligilactobacillus murinus]|uniref:hypothetical protein n=1 Tax=Ligilactobacillus murinus TaxID=1622 RepID=UPI00096EB121|nr:hypothetical protein [Ligilactobacillus murinus]
MKTRDDSKVIERMKYFNEILVPKYEKQFNTSLEDICLWDPLNITNYPEEVEAAIVRLEKAIKDNQILLDEDGEPLEPQSEDVIY